MKGQAFIIIAIIFTILVAIFAVTNVNTVRVNYFFWSVNSPLILVILFSVLMGGIITAAASMLKMFQMNREIKKLKKEIQGYKSTGLTVKNEKKEEKSSPNESNDSI